MRVKNVEFIYKKFACSFLTVALVLSTSLLFSSPDKLAFAETNDTDAKPDALQQQVEDSAKKYEEASARAEELQGQIDNNQKRIDEINKQIPEQQEKAGGALRQLYFLDSGFGVLLNSILGIEDLTTAINNFNYLEHIRDKNMTELESLSSMKKELDELQSGLDQQKRDADQQVTQSQIALQEAQAAREEAQRKAEEEAQRERKAAEEKAKKTEEASDSSDSNTSINVPNSDNADWSVDKQSFVNALIPICLDLQCQEQVKFLLKPRGTMVWTQDGLLLLPTPRVQRERYVSYHTTHGVGAQAHGAAGTKQLEHMWLVLSEDMATQFRNLQLKNIALLIGNTGITQLVHK